MRTFLFGCVAALFIVPVYAGESLSFDVGGVRVWCIADAMNERDIGGIFPDNLDVVRQVVPGGIAESGVYTFLYRIDGKYVLVDTGFGRPDGGLANGLRELGVGPEEIDAVVITHMHGDHIGGLQRDGKALYPNATLTLGRIEHDYWLSAENRKNNPARQGNFDSAKAAVDAYRNRLRLVEFGEEAAPGLTALDAVGHTPGHTALLLESNGEKLLCFADLIHAAALQFPRPDMSPSYDMDPAAARETRIRYLKMAAEQNIPVTGMHLSRPGAGRVGDNGDGSFTFTPGL